MTPGYFIIHVCPISMHPCVCGCVCVCVVVVCFLVAEGSRCYWGFLYEHVNKRKPPKSSLVCAPANENWAPSCGQPVDSEKGGVTELHEGGDEKKNSSTAQSFESGTGSDSRAVTKALPLWLNGTSRCCWARHNGCGFLTIMAFRTT